MNITQHMNLKLSYVVSTIFPNQWNFSIGFSQNGPWTAKFIYALKDFSSSNFQPRNSETLYSKRDRGSGVLRDSSLPHGSRILMQILCLFRECRFGSGYTTSPCISGMKAFLKALGISLGNTSKQIHNAWRRGSIPSHVFVWKFISAKDFQKAYN